MNIVTPERFSSEIERADYINAINAVISREQITLEHLRFIAPYNTLAIHSLEIRIDALSRTRERAFEQDIDPV